MIVKCSVLTLAMLGLVCGGVLEDYVYRHDPHYKYEMLKKHTYKGPDYTLYVLNMTSQKWKDESVTTSPIWWHYMTITVPDKILIKDTALMFITDGSNHDEPPTNTDKYVAGTTQIAVGIGCIGGTLKQIPNEPVTFLADPTHKPRYEDAIVAWTWKQFIKVNSSDPEMILQLPMTKASVRGMDTIASFASEMYQNKVDTFYVAGFSKHGWAAWTTAAVDPRVKGISPIVMDVLHMSESLHHQFRAYGGWTFAFQDYYKLNITASMDSPNMLKMMNIIDPISYNNKLTMPKLIISASGDEYFMPDDSCYYFSELNGPNYLRMLPNTEHLCTGHFSSIMSTMRAFFMSLSLNYPLPKFSWKRQVTRTGGRITVKAETDPLAVTCYSAKTIGGKRRDFRLFIGAPGNPDVPFPHPVIWYKNPVQHLGNRTYMVEFDNPKVGWRAFFIELTFRGAKDSLLNFTTETQIIPDTFPFPDCYSASCKGTLV